MTKTMDFPGYEMEEAIDVVRGNTVRVRNICRKVGAAFRNIFIGSIPECTAPMAQGRDDASDGKLAVDERIGDGGTVNIRVLASTMMQG